MLNSVLAVVDSQRLSEYAACKQGHENMILYLLEEDEKCLHIERFCCFHADPRKVVDQRTTSCPRAPRRRRRAATSVVRSLFTAGGDTPGILAKDRFLGLKAEHNLLQMDLKFFHCQITWPERAEMAPLPSLHFLT